MEETKVTPLGELAKYRALAENRGNALKYTQEYMGGLFEKAEEYVKECAESGKPMTIAGWQMAMGVPRSAWQSMKKGEYDSRLYEFLAMEGLPLDYADTLEMLVYEKDGKKIPLITYSEFLERIYLQYQDVLEAACQRQRNPVGSIFLLKSVHKFDDQSGTNVTNQTLNVSLATMEETETARRLLG
jgi:hypothetical protein